MIYLFINEGNDDAVMIPMSTVDTIENEGNVCRIYSQNECHAVRDGATLSVLCTEESEQPIAAKIWENFAPKHD